MLRQQIEEILLAKGITKAEFARKMGCLPQNVNALLETDNLKKLARIAEVIGCDVTDFMQSKEEVPQPPINGFIEFDGVVYAIKSLKDFTEFQDIFEKATTKRQNDDHKE